MVHVDSQVNSWHLIDATQPVQDAWIILNPLQIAFEMTMINWVKPNYGCEETDVSFSQCGTSQIGAI